MSKKVFIIVLSVVLVLGAVATAVTAVAFSPFNMAKRSLKSSQTAREIKVTLTQSYFGEVVNKKTVVYKKTEEGYLVTENLQTLSKDPLSENVYENSENSYTLPTFSAKFFNFRSSYLTDKTTKNENASLFTARVKENRIADFFASSEKTSGFKNVFVTVGYSDKTVYLYSVNYKVNDDDFVLLTEFFY